jgi:protein-tyrosine phosphatase
VKRLIPLQGGRNFRDLGGYVTSDGRRVRWGRLFRSGVMSYLTAQDHEYLEPIGIRVLCDFRTRREREYEPTRWGPRTVSYLQWDYDARNVSLRAFLPGNDFSPEIARSAMKELYRKFPSRFQEQYAGLFKKLAAGEVPLVFSCSAGKDRTGLAAALLLASLGVIPEQVMADYVLTDSAVDLEKALFAHPRTSVGLDDHSHLAAVSRESRAPLLKALPEYLQAAFEQIERDHGSLSAYVRAALGVNDEMLQGIRTHLLEE